MSNQNIQKESVKGRLARARSSVGARRPSFAKQRPPNKLVAVVATLAVGGTLALVSAIGGSESTSIAVCNLASQVNTVCNSSNELTLKSAAAGDWWHTSGNQILDSSNNPVYLRGVDDGRMAQSNPGTLPASEYTNLSNWGFNFIRLAITWANLEPTGPTDNGGTLSHTWNQTYLSSIDSVIQQAKANHLRVVLDFHQVNWSPKFSGTGMPAWLFPANPTEGTAKCEFMTNTVESGVPESQQAGLTVTESMIAQRYLNNSTVVGIDMFNEPQSCNYNGKQTYFAPTGGTPYSDFYDHSATAIRAINPNLLLIYEDDAYQSYLKQGFALNRSLNAPNAIFSTHMYPDAWASGNSGITCQPATSITGQQIYTDHLNKANSWNQPFYLGEFDGFHLGANACAAQPNAHQDLLTLMTSAKNDGSNWSLWEYDRNAQSLIDSSGNPKQPLLSDLQSGIDSATSGMGSSGTTTGPTSGKVTLCHAGSGTFNSWDSVAATATVPSGTTVQLRFATASGDCTAPTGMSALSTPLAVSDSSVTNSTASHSLLGLNLADSKVLIIEADLTTTDTTVKPILKSLSLSDSPVNNPPSVPTNLNVTPSTNSANLSWNASNDDRDAQSTLTYKVFRGGVFIWQTAAGVTSYTHTGLTPNTPYSYTVSACDTQGSCSAPSLPFSVTTNSDTTPPSVPTNIRIVISGNYAKVTWYASTDNVSARSQIYYKVYRNGLLRFKTPPGSTAYLDSGLQYGKQYTYRVAACDAAGNCSALSPGRTIKR